MPALSPRLAAVAVAVILTGCGPEAFTFAKDARAQGMKLYGQGDYVDAAAAFANATQQDPRDYQSYYYLGASYQALGKWRQAITAYRSCQGATPMTLAGQQDGTIRYQALDNLAQCIAKSGTANDEETVVEGKNGGHPSVDALWFLAKIQRYAGQADEAIDTYTRASLKDTSRFDIAKEAGLYELGLKQNGRAAQMLKKAYAVNPDDEQVNDALRQLGVVVGPSLRDPSTLSHI